MPNLPTHRASDQADIFQQQSERYLHDPVPVIDCQKIGPRDEILPERPQYIKPDRIGMKYSILPGLNGPLGAVIEGVMAPGLGLSTAMDKTMSGYNWATGEYKDGNLNFPVPDQRIYQHLKPRASRIVNPEKVIGIEQLSSDEIQTVFTVLLSVGKKIEGLILNPTAQLEEELITNNASTRAKIRKVVEAIAEESNCVFGPWSTQTSSQLSEEWPGIFLCQDHRGNKAESPNSGSFLWGSTFMEAKREHLVSNAEGASKSFKISRVKAIIQHCRLIAIAPLEMINHTANLDGLSKRMRRIYEEAPPDPRWTLQEGYFQDLLKT
ncbi:hypothetical protein JKY72_03870 [Candidatus Gracilibacteria bacterium]|nr:hypothetical protein [Candidatus Gracilibacteria bacterium]